MTARMPRPAYGVVKGMTCVGDPVVPFKGGTIAAADGHPRGSSLSVADWRQMWLQIDGCADWKSDMVGTPGRAVTQMVAIGCRAGGEVVNDIIDDATHRWHRAPEFDTTEATWAFVASRLVPS